MGRDKRKALDSNAPSLVYEEDIIKRTLEILMITKQKMFTLRVMKHIKKQKIYERINAKKFKNIKKYRGKIPSL